MLRNCHLIITIITAELPAPEVRIVEHGGSVIHFLLANCKHAQIEIKTDNQNIKGFMLHFAAKRLK